MRLRIGDPKHFPSLPSPLGARDRGGLERLCRYVARPAVSGIEATRRRTDELATARVALRDAMVDELIPPWTGTPWSFYGDADAPGPESAACGYYVSAILRDAGLRVARAKLAQQRRERHQCMQTGETSNGKN